MLHAHVGYRVSLLGFSTLTLHVTLSKVSPALHHVGSIHLQLGRFHLLHLRAEFIMPVICDMPRSEVHLPVEEQGCQPGRSQQ